MLFVDKFDKTFLWTITTSATSQIGGDKNTHTDIDNVDAEIVTKYNAIISKDGLIPLKIVSSPSPIKTLHFWIFNHSFLFSSIYIMLLC